jgi:hypothetical protein
MKNGETYYYLSDYKLENPLREFGENRLYVTQAEAEAELKLLEKRSAEIGEPLLPGQFRVFTYTHREYEND